VSENLQLAAIEIVALVFRERDDKENEVLRSDVLIDDAGAAPRAPTFGGSAQFTETAAAGNQVAQMRMRDEKHLQIQDVRFGKKTGDGFLKGRESDEFHRARVRHWRSVSRGRERQLFQSEKIPAELAQSERAAQLKFRARLGWGRRPLREQAGEDQGAGPDADCVSRAGESDDGADEDR